MITRQAIYQTFRKNLKLPIIANTGTDGGVVLPEGTISPPNWALVDAPAGSTRSLAVLRAIGGFPIPPYIGDNETSAWISPNNTANSVSPPGFYTFRTQFDLSARQSARVKTIGYFAVDNEVINVLINSITTGITGVGFEVFSPPFQILDGFVAGTNTLDFVVINAGGADSPMGFRAELFLQNK